MFGVVACHFSIPSTECSMSIFLDSVLHPSSGGVFAMFALPVQDVSPLVRVAYAVRYL